MIEEIKKYITKSSSVLTELNIEEVENLAKVLIKFWKSKKNIYICGNGGSAANANHICNDLIYGISKLNKKGLNIESLCSNNSVMTCLANDTGYENIFKFQLISKAKKGDLLIVLSGSGNSKNVLKALEFANKIRMETFSILGFNGGKCKKISKNYIHVKINDMQISEDMQLLIFHICMKILSKIKF